MARRDRPYWVHSDPGADSEGQKECARGQWCASPRLIELDDGTRCRAGALGPRVFCDTDESIIARCLDDLPGLYARLAAEPRDHLTPEVLARAPFGPSLPLRGDLDEVMALIVETLASWEERVREVAGLTPSDTQATHARAGAHPDTPVLVPAGRVVSGAVATLAGRLPVLFSLGPEPMVRPVPTPRAIAAGTAPEVLTVAPWPARVSGPVRGETAIVLLDGAWAGREILHLEYGARAVLLEVDPQPEELLGVPCRNCQMLALRRAPLPWHAGETEFWSRCAVCGHLMTHGEYSLWTGQLHAYHRARLAAGPVLGAPA